VRGLSPAQSAAHEAREEGGLVGRVGDQAIGRYHYNKGMPDKSSVPCAVDVFALEVERQLKSWPERNERRTQWFLPEEAAAAVGEPELAALIRDLPKRLA
jgi:8-oxo-dGTP pyrophosphatase MutT (NUDIX family)